MSTFFVPAQKIEFLKNKFAKVERKAKKLKLPIPVFSVNEDNFEIRTVIQEDYNNRVEAKIKYVEVSVEGQLPVIQGWNFVASLEHTRFSDGEVTFNTIRMNPDYPENVDYRTLPPTCEHCGHNRFRKTTYILFNNETGKTMQVGSTCIKDFLANSNPDFIIQSANYVDLLTKFVEEYEHFRFGGFYNEFPIEDALRYTSTEIRLHGWVSRGEVWDTGGSSTSDWVQGVLCKNPEIFTETEKEIFESVNDFDKEIARSAIEWMKSFDLKDPKLNDYLYNCALVVQKEWIGPNDLGIACSIIPAYKYKLAKELESKKEKKVSNFVGKEKERLRDLELTFLRCWTFDSSWGVVNIIRLQDDNGNIFVWKTGYFEEIDPGTKLIMTGTVKKHEIYKDIKQTVLTRCKWDFAEEE